ncbi:methionine gamma-lyase family protein [Bacillus sonorensis]|nr:methionine gamma-lyase family protein [Bacillus sonorensis]
MKKTAIETEKEIAAVHKTIDEIAERNEWRVLESYRKHKVSDTHFTPSTGYGYDDIGRDTLEAVYADVFGGEAGLVRPQIISGTHAISIALFGVLRPGTSFFISPENRMIHLKKSSGSEARNIRGR